MSCAVIRAKVNSGSPASSGFDARRVGGHLGLEQLLGLGQPLDVVRVGVGGDEHLALRQIEVHLPDEFDDFGDGVLVADVDQNGQLVAAVDQIDVDAELAARPDSSTR